VIAGCALPGPTPAPPVAPVEPVQPQPPVAPDPVPDGPLEGTIAFSSDIDGQDDVFILELGLDQARTRLTAERADEFDPAISPDGELIAFRVAARPDSDDADIWLIRRSGRGRLNLTRTTDTANWAPVWTPDGRIAFTSDRDGTLELWSMRPDGTDVRKLAGGWCEYASPAPDGSRVVCATPIGGAYDLQIVDLATGDRQQLTRTPMTEFGASWSPDGRWIAFARDLEERWALMVIRPDGSDEHQVAHEGVFPTWAPDGRLAWSGPGGINVVRVEGGGRAVIDQFGQYLSWSR
jgi:Tol biopolymer transport system component